MQPYPPRPPDAIPVRQARGLPPASFSPRLATRTLRLATRFPLPGAPRDFHPIERVPCPAHMPGMAAIAAMPDALEKLLGAHEAYLGLRRSDKEQASLPKAHDTNRPKHLKE